MILPSRVPAALPSALLIVAAVSVFFLATGGVPASSPDVSPPDGGAGKAPGLASDLSSGPALPFLIQDEGKTTEKGKAAGSSKKDGSTGKKSGKDDEGKGAGDDTDSKSGDEEKQAADGKAGKTALGSDEQYIKDNIEKYLNPTKIEYLEDGKVHLVFNFGDKKDEHMNIFTPPISSDPKSRFRWSLEGEYVLGTWGRAGDEDFISKSDGIRISNEGFAHLNVWFKDDVEVEIAYAQSITSRPKQIIAVIFTNPSGNSLGSNFGSQCALFSGGTLKKAIGEYESIKNETATKIKLAVKDASFHAYRDGKKRSSSTYSPKSYASGRVGWIWGGGIASFVYKLDIKGNIDAKKMAEQLRKAEQMRKKGKK